MAVVTLVGLFSTVCSLVSFHVILLDKSHPALIAAKRLLPFSIQKHENTCRNIRACQGTEYLVSWLI